MYPCSICGLCCKSISNVDQLKKFDRGDGVCKHFDERTNLCLIYEQRPLVCNIEKSYYKNYQAHMTKTEFYIENSKICNFLQKNNMLNEKFNIIIGE